MNYTDQLKIILKIILAAAVVTFPIFSLSEEISWVHTLRVLLINGGTIIVALVLLKLTQRGYGRSVGAGLVWSLFALIAGLAATNGEPIATNVVNFIIVLIVANLLLSGLQITLVSVACVAAMVVIAYLQSKQIVVAKEVGDSFAATLSEFVAQFIIVAILIRLLSRRVEARGG
jgi:hypothetical protein